MIDLNEMAGQMYEVALKRESHSPYMNSLTSVELLKHLAGEVVEASMAYGVGAEPYRMELGDILCMTMLLAHKENFDIEKMLSDVLAKNTERANRTGDKL
jgi:NTP pyrophosphatase (non-canonical NTP hydrolase)